MTDARRPSRSSRDATGPPSARRRPKRAAGAHGRPSRGRRASSRPAAEDPPAPTLAADATPSETVGGRWRTPPAADARRLPVASSDAKVASAFAFLRRRVTGDFEVDDFGYDAELTDKVLLARAAAALPALVPGRDPRIENVPAERRGARRGQPLGHDRHRLGHDPARPARPPPARTGPCACSAPTSSSRCRSCREFARKTGATLACNADAERLLDRGEVVGVWPEGFKGVGKPFSERYKLQRFGRGGFVAAALRAKVPIIPVSIVGAEEIYPIIGNVKTLARLLGAAVLPDHPDLPLARAARAWCRCPSKWIIEFGEPIPTDDYADGAADDPMLVFNLTDQVRETIQHTLYRLLVQRRSVFF